MKTLLLFLLTALAISTVRGAAPESTPAPDAPKAKISAKVMRILPGWILVDASVRTPGEEDFEGRLLLRGLPNQATMAVDEDLAGITAVRLPKPFKIDGQVLRAYEYRAAAPANSAPSKAPWKPLGTALDQKPR